MIETGDVSKSQRYGAMKKGVCTKCGLNVSKMSYADQTKHEEKCAKQERLF